MKERTPAAARNDLRRLLAGQKLGVLATRERRSPYQSLVAFAASADLRHLYFATAKNTRKHANLVRSPGASMLIDDRRNVAADFDRGVAVTALGRAEAVKPGSRKAVFALYLGKHPSLAGFVQSPACQMFQLKVETYVMVGKFEQVRVIEP
jgi:nitroimidazol reductase NimA-like FMN-containing flavoprotein (pyridoxamine 5'-phosphate oxidase superfamily)